MTTTARQNYCRSLHLDDKVTRCATGLLLKDSLFFESGSHGIALPPAMLPFWGDGDSSDGYWRHWFVNRGGSFVMLLHDGGPFLPLEVARTSDQFFDEFFLDRISDDEGISKRVANSASELGISNLEMLNAFASQEKWAPEDLPSFQSLVPSQRVRTLETYDGDFPIPLIAASAKWETCCQMEANAVLRHKVYLKNREKYLNDANEWTAHAKKSPWLSWDTDKRDVFTHYMGREDWGRAWLSLHAHGWEVGEVSDALRLLERKTQAPGFDLLVAAWHEMLPEWTVRQAY